MEELMQPDRLRARIVLWAEEQIGVNTLRAREHLKVPTKRLDQSGACRNFVGSLNAGNVIAGMYSAVRMHWNLDVHEPARRAAEGNFCAHSHGIRRCDAYSHSMRHAVSPGLLLRNPTWVRATEQSGARMVKGIRAVEHKVG